MPPVLNRGWTRPSALPSLLHLYSLRTTPVTLTKRCYATSIPSIRVVPTRPSPSLADVTRARDDLASARRPHPSPDHKNLLAPLVSWTPLYQRLRQSPDAFLAFRHEADVVDTMPKPDGAEKRFVDDSDHSHNMALWLEVLSFRLRLDGHQGVSDVLHGMIQRHVVLPLHGSQASEILSIFLHNALQSSQLLEALYTWLTQTLPPHHLRQVNLYGRIIGTLLRQNPRFVTKWHKRMQNDQLLPTDHVSLFAQLVEEACLCHHRSKAFEAIKKIYLSIKPHGVYDECMPRICRLTDFHCATDMHVFFTRYDDNPSSKVALTPVVRHVADSWWLAPSNINPGARRFRFAKQLLDAQHTFRVLSTEAQVTDSETMPPLTRENMNTIVGDVHEIREKELRDSFCARVFATTAFSIDLIITGLSMLGLQTVGNLAVREIAARAPTPADYVATIKAINKAGISVADSVFSRALYAFAATSDKSQSFDYLISSNQHPTAYEDRELLIQLFSEFAITGKTIPANAMLDVLTMGKTDPQSYHANLILQMYARKGRRESVLQVLHEMRLHRIVVSRSALTTLHSTMLRPRRPSKKPITQAHLSYGDDMNLVTNALLEAMLAGRDVDPWMWREILKRYGMSNKLQALEKLVTWLLNWYSGRFGRVQRPSARPSCTHTPNHDYGSTRSIVGGQHPLSVIFDEYMLRAFIAWGFKGEGHNADSTETESYPGPQLDLEDIPSEEKPVKIKVESWARGLALVRELAEFGVILNKKRLVREVKLRIWILYGPGQSSRLTNRLTQEQNNLSLSHRLAHIESIMGRYWLKHRSFRVPLSANSDRAIYRALFGQPRRTKRSTRSARVENVELTGQLSATELQN